MKQSRKPKEFCFTLVVLGVLVLLFLATTSSAKNNPATKTKQNLRYITNQYKEIAAEYLPGTSYEQAMNELISKVEAMSEDESSMEAQILKPLIPSMLANLQTFRDALSSLNKPKALTYGAAAANEFPDAQYPNVQLAGYPDFLLSNADKLLSIPISLIALLTTFKLPAWAPAELNGLPLTCLTALDADGKPIRVPDETMMALRLSVQIAEVIKEGANVILEQAVVGVFFGEGAGGNLKVLTIVPTGIYLLQKNIYENLKECDSAISSAEATASYQRLGHLHGDLDNVTNKMDTAQGSLSSINSKLDTAQGDLSSLKTKMDIAQGDLTFIKKKLDTAQGDLSGIKGTLNKMDTKLDTIIELLNTPPGKRPDFPKK